MVLSLHRPSPQDWHLRTCLSLPSGFLTSTHTRQLGALPMASGTLLTPLKLPRGSPSLSQEQQSLPRHVVQPPPHLLPAP